MTLNAPTIITIVFVLLFYLRLMVIQWGYAKKARSSYQKAQSAPKKGSATKGSDGTFSPQIHVTSWYLVGAGVVLIVLGAVLQLVNGLSDTIRGLWWIPLNLGILLFTFSFK